MDTSDLNPGKAYIFRVAAMNSKGLGPYSDNSTTFLAPHGNYKNLTYQKDETKYLTHLPHKIGS